MLSVHFSDWMGDAGSQTLPRARWELKGRGRVSSTKEVSPGSCKRSLSEDSAVAREHFRIRLPLPSGNWFSDFEWDFAYVLALVLIDNDLSSAVENRDIHNFREFRSPKDDNDVIFNGPLSPDMHQRSDFIGQEMKLRSLLNADW